MASSSVQPLQPKSFNQTYPVISAFGPELRIGDFSLGRCLGGGKFGEVYMSLHKKTEITLAEFWDVCKYYFIYNMFVMYIE